MATIKAVKPTTVKPSTTTVKTDGKENSNTPKPDGKELNGKEIESKDSKFKRLAIPRTKKICKAIQGIGNLSNRNTYKYTDEQVQTIFSLMQKVLDEQKSKFAKQADKQKDFEVNL